MQEAEDDVTTPADDDNSGARAINDASMTSSGHSDATPSPSSNSDGQPNQMQLLNLHYEVKRYSVVSVSPAGRSHYV